MDSPFTLCGILHKAMVRILMSLAPEATSATANNVSPAQWYMVGFRGYRVHVHSAPNDGGLGAQRVLRERVLDLGGAHAVAGHV